MQSFRHFITELFDRGVDFNWVKEGKDYKSYFTVDNNQYEVIFEDKIFYLEIHFNMIDKEGNIYQEITDTGNEIKVFSTIFNSIDYYINNTSEYKFKDKFVIISDKKESKRENLYFKMVKRFISNYKNLEIENIEEGQRWDGKNISAIIIKKTE